MSPAEFADLFRACPEGREWAIANCATMDDAWSTALPEWLFWIATRPGVLDDRTLRLFAVWSARQVQHLMTDPRSIAALDVAERHANGEATDNDLAAARDAAVAAAVATARAATCAAEWAAWAAVSAARDAARDAAWDAAVSSAWDAARAAAGSSAVSAAVSAARDAAWDAALAAAGAAQAAWLRANATPDWERARKMGGAR